MVSDMFRGLDSSEVDVSLNGAEVRRSADLQKSKFLHFIKSEFQKAKTIVRPRFQAEDFCRTVAFSELIDD